MNFSELAASGVVREKLPALADAASTVGSKQIRNRGTIAGNVGSASPAGDMLPVLLLYGASRRPAARSLKFLFLLCWAKRASSLSALAGR